MGRKRETKKLNRQRETTGNEGAREAKLADRRNGAARGRAIGERKKERETEKEGERADGRLA